MPGFLHADRKQGDQGMDALHYTERTGTASNAKSRAQVSGPRKNSHSFCRGTSILITRCSIPEPIPQPDIDFAWVIPVEATKGLDIIEFDAAVGDVQCVQRCGSSLAEILAQREIEGGVSGEVAAGIRTAWVGVAEAGAVVNVGRCVGTPRQRDVGADVERVALIVVELAESRARIAEISGAVGQTSGDGTATVGNLVRIGEMKLGATGDAR